MKLSKSTTVLLNVVLFLLIAILMKSLIAVPKSMSAAPTLQYSLENIAQGESVQQALNKKATEGWRLAFAFKHPQLASYTLILEK